MVKTAVLSFRVNDDTKAALERAAAAEDRSVSSLCERILRDWLAERKYLRQPTRKPRAR